MSKVYFVKDIPIPDKKPNEFNEQAYVTFCYYFLEQLKEKLDYSKEVIEKDGKKYLRQKMFVPFIGKRTNTHYDIKTGLVPHQTVQNRQKKEKAIKKEYKIIRPDEVENNE